VLESFLPPGDGEFIGGFAGPFTLLIIADLLGVPLEDRPEFLERLHRRPAAGGIGSTGDDHLAHSPLEFLYGRFTEYIEDRRRAPRDDVLTGLATATFPDGSTPEVIDAVRVAANLFSAGQETTVRLLGAGLKILAEQPDLQALLRREPHRIPNFVEETLRLESPVKGDFRLSRVPATVGGVDLPAGTTVMVVNGAANRDPRKFAEPGAFDLDRGNARHHLSFGRGIHTCPGAPLARAEGRVAIERLLQRTTAIRLSERVHGPADDRRFRYLPTFILRGLTHLNLEFDLP
jgi:cytochrome P450